MIVFPAKTKRVGKCLEILSRGLGGQNQYQEDIDKPLRRRQSEYISYEGKSWRTSRLSYNLNVKKIPRAPGKGTKKPICHTCDNRWCVEPSHLYYGTQSQNMKDKWERHPTYKTDRTVVLKRAWERGCYDNRPSQKSTPKSRRNIKKAIKAYWDKLGSEGRKREYHRRRSL